MPLKLKPPRAGKTPYYSIRGTYLGIGVDKSCGTARRSLALQRLKDLQGQIERGEYPRKAKTEAGEERSFLSAARGYLEAGRRRRYVGALIKHFGETPLSQIDQRAIDDAAAAILPNVTPATRNTCVYTPMSAILHHAGIDIQVKRPKGAKGRVITDWLVDADAFGIVAAAERFDPEYATLLKFLLYTGVRLGAALNLQREDIRFAECMAWVRHQKGQPASDVKLREDLCDALAAHLATHDNRRVFRFRQGGHLKHQLVRAKLGYLGIDCPVRRPTGWRAPPYRLSWANHHTFRHTWATWMRRAGTDVKGLVATGNWRDERTAARYAHAVARDEWNRVKSLPAAGGVSVEKARG
jgi:integrase